MPRLASIGGILSIVSGALGILIAIVIIVFSLFFNFLIDGTGGGFNSSEEEAFILIAVVYGIMGLFYGLIGVLGVVGGIFAIKKKHWGWALAGAIAGSMTFYFTGIAAVVLVSLAKPEFTRLPAQAPASIPEPQI